MSKQRVIDLNCNRETSQPGAIRSLLGKRLPMTLGDALEALKNDDVIRSAMPGEMYRLYDEYKRDEWERFLHTSTEWDLDTYLNCLP